MITAKILADNISNNNRITTFELEYPRFILSELNTHRCLAGDTLLYFDFYGMSVERVYNEWNFSETNNIPNKQLCYYNRLTKMIEYTFITDIWKVGDKDVFEVVTEDHKTIRCTEDHPFLTKNGYVELKDLNVHDNVLVMQHDTVIESTIVSITEKGVQTVYDLTVDNNEHNFIANGFVVHNCFSRNSASSRAIPVDKMIELVRKNPVVPIWTYNQKGMSGKIVDDPDIIYEANVEWTLALEDMITHVENLKRIGIHKQNSNRLLEPFQHMKTVLTSTDFSNFFKLRISPAAQPEICELATKMRDLLVNHMEDLLDNSKPHVLNGDVHCPYTEHGYCSADDIESIYRSVAMCAQVSYRKEDGSPETVKRIVNNLIGHEQIHASPFEHIAIGYNALDRMHDKKPKGNLKGFHQLRHCVEKAKDIDNDLNYDKLIKIGSAIWGY